MKVHQELSVDNGKHPVGERGGTRTSDINGPGENELKATHEYDSETDQG